MTYPLHDHWVTRRPLGIPWAAYCRPHTFLWIEGDRVTDLSACECERWRDGITVCPVHGTHAKNKATTPRFARRYLPLEMCVYRDGKPITVTGFYQTWLYPNGHIQQTLYSNGLEPGKIVSVRLNVGEDIYEDWLNVTAQLLNEDGELLGRELPALIYAKPWAVPMATVFPPLIDNVPHVLTLRCVGKSELENDQ